MPAETFFSYTNLTAAGGGYGFHLYNSSSLWTFNNNISASVNDPVLGYSSGIFGDNQWNGNTLVVNSEINSVYASGIHLAGSHNTIRIGATGTVGGKGSGVRMTGDHSELINDGIINGTGNSITIQGNSYASFVNNNTVNSSVSIKAKIVNISLGDKSKLNYFLKIDSSIGEAATTLNKGEIAATPSGWSYIGGDGSDTLTNRGTIKGGVDLRDGNDTFDNRGGTVMGPVYGGKGNDTFIVDSATVEIKDGDNDGIDTVQSTVSLSFNSPLYETQELEYLTLIGNAAINGTGNDLDNVLTGNTAANLLQGLDGDDILDGGAGADRLEGGTGDDIYHVDHAGDVVVEAANAGSDTVIAAASHTLATDAHVEYIEAAAGALNLALTGSGFANTLIGSAGHDTLDGGAGADRLEGGLGNDTYVVDSLDTVVDAGGIDTVKAAASFSIAALAAIEKLVATGTAAINLTGNGLDNTLTGNAAANKVSGGLGNDKLWGGLGKDVLTGGKGKDTFVFDTKPNKKTNLDKIVDFNVKDDSFWLDNKVFAKLGKGTEAKPGKLNKGFFTIGDKAKDKNDYLVYNAKTGALSYDVDGSGSKAMVQIATLKTGLKLTYADFFVI